MGDQRTLTVVSLHSTFAAEIQGVDWTKPLSDSVIAEIKQAIDKYGVLIFRKANIDNETHVAFTARFGNMDYMPYVRRKGRFPEHPQIFDISNIADNNEIIQPKDRATALLAKGNELWHCDMQYHPHRDQYSFLRAVELPPKEVCPVTEYADARAAYEDLSDEWKATLDGKVVNCSLLHNRRTAAPDLYYGVDAYEWPISRWKAVYPHEGSGRNSLYLTSYCYQIDGYSIEESQKMATELLAHGSQPKYVFKAVWEQPGDMIMWDNTAVWHRATESSDYQFKYRRDMRRTNTFDDGPHGYGENDPNDDWRIKLPAEPFAIQRATL